MLVVLSSENIHPEWSRSVVCIGTFDGLHLGHQKLISRAVSRAEELEVPCIVLTFDRHPLSIVKPELAPQCIALLDENLQEMHDLGVSVAVVLKFDDYLANCSADEFYQNVLMKTLKASEVFMGGDGAFGKGREGNVEWLRGRMPTTVVDYVELEGMRISSTKIRSLIKNGDVSLASRMMGRSYSLSGVVVSGQKLGRTLGFPTINIARPKDFVLPKNGIYSGWCKTVYGYFKAAISIGVRPTVDGGNRVIEAHLLDYPGDSLYSKPVKLGFAHRLRDEMKFASLDQLKNEIQKDVDIIRMQEILFPV